MAFQLDEKMMAHNRAIITRNKTERDLLKDDIVKFKPGMIHYVADTKKLFLSIEPETTANGQRRAFVEIQTEKNNTQLDYVHRDGGQQHSIRGTLYSDVQPGTTPMVILSDTKVDNLNADKVDNMHVDVASSPNSIVGRDVNGNINIESKLNLAGAYIRNVLNEIHVNETNDTTYAPIKSGKLTIDGGEVRLNNIGASSGITIVENDATNIARLAYNDAKRVWECGLEGDLNEIVTEKNLPDKASNIFTQSSEPTNVSSDNTYWYEIV